MFSWFHQSMSFMSVSKRKCRVNNRFYFTFLNKRPDIHFYIFGCFWCKPSSQKSKTMRWSKLDHLCHSWLMSIISLVIYCFSCLIELKYRWLFIKHIIQREMSYEIMSFLWFFCFIIYMRWCILFMRNFWQHILPTYNIFFWTF